MLNKQLLKIVSVFSFITGAAIGVIPLIPAFISVAFLLIMFCVAPFIIIYLKHLGFIKEISTEQTLIIGGISGAVGFLGFATIYFPIAFILNLIFKIQSFMWIKVLFTNFVFLVPMIVLISLFCAMLNAFSGLITIYFYKFFQKK